MLLNGKGAAPGIVLGSIFVYKKNINIPVKKIVPAGEEQSHLDHYLEIKKKAIDELEKIMLIVKEHDPQKAEIFKAHQAIVDDVVMNEEIPAKILNEHWAGDWAVYYVYENVLAVLRKTADPLIAERAVDFTDVRSLLLRLWNNQENENLSFLSEPVIIAAHDLMPSDTASLDREKVLAILTETGGITSHTAIIAKSYGIPAVLGIKGLLDVVKQGQIAAVNAGEGTVILEPEEAVAKEYKNKIGVLRREKSEAERFRDMEARTTDGVKIDIGLNISNIGDEELKAFRCTDFVGLFRTEFLYMGRGTLPSEDEQFSAYRNALESFPGRQLTLRTLDIGGDKKLSSIELPHEDNPFLGNRALRLCFSRTDLFKTQIRAILRASVYGDLWLMLPMVSSIDDIRKAKEYIAQAKEELKKEGETYKDVKTGIMIEVPSIALTADLAAKEADFASIGSNDLCQYLCAADRMNTEVEPYYQSYHPAMFRLIKETVAAFTHLKKPISICGELGADPAAVPVLIGLGLRKFSMGAASVAAVKKAIASVSVKQAEKTAGKVLQLSTASEIADYIK